MTQLRDKETTRITLQRQGVRPCRQGHIGGSGSGRGAQVLVAGKFCDSAHIAVCPVERGGDREMAQLLRADRETTFGAEPADDVVDRGASQTMAFAGPVEIDEQRTGFGAARLEPSSECGPGRVGQYHRLLLL